MMNRKFTAREKVLLVVFAAVLLGIGYYLFLWRPVVTEIATAKAQLEQLSQNSETEQMRAAQKKKMEDELTITQSENQGKIMPYNNIKNEMNDLYFALASANSYNLSFSDAVATDTTVRRDITVTFEAGSWETAYDILQKIHDGQYRCQLKDLSMNAITAQGTVVTDQNAGAEQTKVNVTVAIRFFETTIGAVNTNGLKFEKQDKAVTGETSDADLTGTKAKK